ncbi:MAG: hypothetical protein JW881_19065 [Spirochaetales bacterium]|nr:hypothetical protein [Spirochaetales bacterium]
MIGAVEELTNIIAINYVDPEINQIIEGVPARKKRIEKRFTGNEEFFLKLKESFTVPHFPIHHDVRKREPEEHYIRALRESCSRFIKPAGDLFSGCTFFFDPSDILKPCFFKLYRINDAEYLFFIKVDLGFRARYGTIIRWGTNDTTPEYETHFLFIEALLIPLESINIVDDRIESFVIRQTISETWIGEHGRGYLLRGIWIDDELTRFFTRLFLPRDLHIYPYFPFICKYKTMCMNLIDLAPCEREKRLPLLHNALAFVSPHMRIIESSMKSEKFREELEVFQTLKKDVPAEWNDVFASIRIRPYLNGNNMKEFAVED